MPDFAAAPVGDYSGISAGSNLGENITPDIQRSAASAIHGTDYSLPTSVAGHVALGVADLIDTVTTSIPGLSKITGLERGQVNEKMLQAIDMPGLSDFYHQNTGSIQAVSGIMGVIAADVATRGLAAEGSPLIAALKLMPGAEKVMALDSTYKRALAAVRAADVELGRRGVLGAEQYVGAVEGLGGGVKIGRDTLATRARLFGAAKGALRAAGSEAVMAVTLNQNEFLYSDDASTNIMFAGFGVGIGGAVGAVSANYVMRKFVNSDRMQRIYAGALDATGLEHSMLDTKTLPEALKGGDEGASSYMGNLRGYFTDRVTAFMVKARSAVPDGVDASTYRRLANENESLAHQEANKATVKGIAGVGQTSFGIDSMFYGNAVKEALHNDPGALLGVEMIGGVGDGMSTSAVHQAHVANVQKQALEAANFLTNPAQMAKATESEIVAARQAAKAAKFAEKLTPVPIIDGQATTLTHAESYDGWVEPLIKQSKSDGVNIWESFSSEGNAHKVGIDNDMELYLPGDRTVNNADHFDMLRLYRSGQKMIQNLVNSGGTLTLPANPTWFHLDMAETLLKKTEGRAKVVFPAGMSREAAQVESFAQKVEALKNGFTDPDLIEKARVRFNLPRLTAYEQGVLSTSDAPIDTLIRGFKGDGKAARAMSLDELKNGMYQAQKLNDLTALNKGSKELMSGNSFDFMTDYKGNPTKVVLTYKRPFNPTDWTRDNLAERLAQRKINVITALTDSRADDATRSMVTGLVGSADFQTSARPTALADVQMSAATPGFGNLSPTGGVRAVTDSVSTTEWKFRDNPVMLALTRVREGMERTSQKMMKQVFETAFEGQLQVLQGPRNETSNVLLNQFHSFAGGWRLEAEPIEQTLPNGTKGFMFALTPGEENAARFRAQYGREMQKGEVLLTAKGQPMVLDELAMDLQNRFNAVTSARRIQQNVLAASQGLPEIRQANHYIPAPDVEGKYIGFTFDPANKIVPGNTIIANSSEEFDRQLAKLRGDAESALNREGHVFMTLGEVKTHATLLDQAEAEMHNPGRTFIAGGKSNLGKSAQREYNPNAFQDSLKSMRDGFLQHGRDIMEILYRDQIAAAKIRAEVASATVTKEGGKTIKNRSIFDYYVQEATGRSPLSSEKSWVGRKYNEVENSFNSLSESLAPGISRAVKTAGGFANNPVRDTQVFKQVKDYLSQANPFTLKANEQDAFTRMTEALGEFMPFKSTAEYIEAQNLGKRPPTLAGLTAATSRFESTWVLRMLEPMQAAMNIGGMINAAPAVIRHLEQRAGETTAAHAARIGHSADIFETPDGRSYGVLNTSKMMYRAFMESMGKVTDPRIQAGIDHAIGQGTMSQEVAEFQRAFKAAETRSGWDVFMNGTQNPKNAGLKGTAGVMEDIQRKGLVGWLSVLTDKTEDWSRQYGHIMGLHLAQDMGVNSVEAAHNFAHDVANKMIANYSPHNRPEIFQGAVGAPIGLFQSFIWAYYQRMFRYIETGDGRALATQYAMQTGMFGLKSVPGWKEVNDMAFQHDQGKSSPYDSIIARFGSRAGDALMYGSLGSLPKLFGGEAMDLESRGDTTFRTPAINAPAVVTTATKIAQGVGAAIGLFSQQNPHLSGQQIGEVLANTLPNRPLAGIIEQFSGGADTDSRGQIVGQTRSGLEAAYRMLGTRSVRQSQETEAFYSNKSAMEIKANQDQILLRNTRAYIRSNGGSLDGLEGVFEQYVANGGDPRNYKRWLKSTFKSATMTRAEQQLQSSLKSPTRQAQAQRLLNAHVGIDEAAGEPPVNEDTMGLPDTMDGAAPVASSADNPSLIYDGQTQ